MVAVIGFALSVNANCVVMRNYGTAVYLINSCNRPVEVSVSWTDAGGQAHIRNVTVPAWNERTNQNGHIRVNIGDRATNVRMGEPRRVVPRR